MGLAFKSVPKGVVAVIEYYKSYKIRLLPTEEQEEIFETNCNIARYIYNQSVELLSFIDSAGYTITENELREQISTLKHSAGHEWISKAGHYTITGAVHQCYSAYKYYKQGINKFPKMKTKKYSKPLFMIRATLDKNLGIQGVQFIDNKHVKLQKIGIVQLENKKDILPLKELFEHNARIYKVRICKEDGNWFMCFALKHKKENEELNDIVIGIDVGIKELAVCSNGNVYENINKTSKNIMKLEKKKREIKRRIERKKRQNQIKYMTQERPKYSNNIKKEQKKIRKIEQRIQNIRRTYNHQVSRSIVNERPALVVMENLNFSTLKKKSVYLQRMLEAQRFSELQEFIKYKTENQGGEFERVPRYYKSSQICCCCHSSQKIKLTDRIYKCPVCGMELDRDLNAAINLEQYGQALQGNEF